MLVAAVLAVRGGLALQHLTVLRDAVSLGHGDICVVGVLLASRRCPREVVSPHFDVVVSELAELIVVHAEQFGLFRGAEVQAGDEVDGVGKNDRHGEGVGGGGDDVGDLHVHLPPVVVDEAASDEAGVDAVEADDVVGAEEGVEEEADHASNSMFRKNIERIVDSEEILDCV